MTDEERLEAILNQCENDKDQLEMLKYYHRESQRGQLKNARDYDAGKKSLDVAEKDRDAAIAMKANIEHRLKQTDAGKQYLYGPEAQDVASAVLEDDVQARAKAADAKRKRVASSKQQKDAERWHKTPSVSARDLDLNKEHKKDKAAEIMEYLAKRQKDRQDAKGLATLVEKMKEKDKGKQPGSEWEPE